MPITWCNAVLGCIKNLTDEKKSDCFSRQELIDGYLDRIVRETGSSGDSSTTQSLSRALYDLRDNDCIEFVDDNGNYKIKNIVNGACCKPYSAPGINSGDVEKYLIEKRVLPCSSCGKREFTVLVNGGEDMIQALSVYSATSKIDGGFNVNGPYPVEINAVIPVMCKNCGHVDIFSANEVYKWKLARI